MAGIKIEMLSNAISLQHPSIFTTVILKHVFLIALGSMY